MPNNERLPSPDEQLQRNRLELASHLEFDKKTPKGLNLPDAWLGRAEAARAEEKPAPETLDKAASDRKAFIFSVYDLLPDSIKPHADQLDSELKAAGAFNSDSGLFAALGNVRVLLRNKWGTQEGEDYWGKMIATNKKIQNEAAKFGIKELDKF